MADLTLKRNDTWPPVKAQLMQLNPETGLQEPIDLTSALKVTLILKSGATLIEGICTYGPGETAKAKKEGKVEYAWAVGDTKTAGTYEVEFEIEWTATHIESVPNDSYKSIAILADLPNA